MRSLVSLRGLSGLLLAFYLAPGPVTAGQPAYETEYQKASTEYYKFKADEKRRKFRHHWHKTARLFERVADRYPDSTRADDALFTAGKLYYELYVISRVAEDLDHAVDLMLRLVERHPDSHLADDAQLYVALQWIEFRKKPDKAVKELAFLVEQFPDGDVTPKARRMLEDLGGPEEPEKKKIKKADTPATKGKPILVKVQYDSGPDYTRVTLHTQVKTKYKFGVLDADEKNKFQRLYIDLQGIRLEPGLAGPIDVRDSVVRRIRFGPFSEDVVRVVLDLSTLGEHKLFPMDNPARVVIDVSAAGGDKSKPRVPPKSASRPGQSLSMLAGLKVRRIVIDPGHGGRDPGAIGPKKTLEKDITLDIARRLAKLLRKDEKLGIKDVVLTRTGDRFVALERRAAIANSKKADLFISIHCNAHRIRRLRGVETFYLDLTNDRYSIKLAARENATSEKTISDLKFILADLALKSHVDDSITLGRAIQKATVGKLRRHYKRIKDLKLKPALFYVLIGARMPSVLVETSFISNAEEEGRLRTKTYRRRVAEGIHAGIKSFIEARNRELDPDS